MAELELAACPCVERSTVTYVTERLKQKGLRSCKVASEVHLYIITCFHADLPLWGSGALQCFPRLQTHQCPPGMVTGATVPYDSNSVKLLAAAALLTGSLSIAQLAIGLHANSLLLVSDAVLMLCDVGDI